MMNYSLRDKLLFTESLEDCRGDEVHSEPNMAVYREEDVWEAVGKMLQWQSEVGYRTSATKKAKEIFGESLVKEAFEKVRPSE